MYTFCWGFSLISRIFPVWVFCVWNARHSSCSLSLLLSSFNYCLILQNLSCKELAKNRLVTVSTSSHLLFSGSLQGWPAFLFGVAHQKQLEENQHYLVNISSVRRRCWIKKKKLFLIKYMLFRQFNQNCQMWRGLGSRFEADQVLMSLLCCPSHCLQSLQRDVALPWASQHGSFFCI